MGDLIRMLTENSYPGRGILVGRDPLHDRTLVFYFLTGRSENSRNRIFEKTDDGIRTRAYDESKMTDPSLIIYRPLRHTGGTWIITNGVFGRLVTGKGAYANRSIFLPAAGYGNGSRLSGPGLYGTYWFSTSNSDYSNDAWYLFFDSSYFGRLNYFRYSGQSVRPVRGSAP